MPPEHTCIRDEDIKRLEGLVEKVFLRMDTFLDDMHKAHLADVSRSNKIDVIERDLDRAFDDIRTIKDDVKVLNDWRQRFEGAIKVMLAIPVVCTIITTLIALWQLLS